MYTNRKIVFLFRALQAFIGQGRARAAMIGPWLRPRPRLGKPLTIIILNIGINKEHTAVFETANSHHFQDPGYQQAHHGFQNR